MTTQDDSQLRRAVARVAVLRELRVRRRALAFLDPQMHGLRADLTARLAMAECALEGLRAAELAAVRS